MALTVGVNSWVDVDDANDYLFDTPGASKWFNLIAEPITGRYEDSRASYLVLAFRVLSNNPELLPIDPTCTDVNVIHAQIEMALFLVKYKDEYERRDALISAGVKSFTLSKWEEELGEIQLPSNVSALLKDYSKKGARIVQLLGEDYLE